MHNLTNLSKTEMKLELKKLGIHNIEEALALMTVQAFEEGSPTGNIKEFCFAIDITNKTVIRILIWRSLLCS